MFETVCDHCGRGVLLYSHVMTETTKEVFCACCMGEKVTKRPSNSPYYHHVVGYRL